MADFCSQEFRERLIYRPMPHPLTHDLVKCLLNILFVKKNSTDLNIVQDQGNGTLLKNIQVSTLLPIASIILKFYFQIVE